MAASSATWPSDPEGATAYIDADLGDPNSILAEAARALDFSQPMAIILLLILHLIPDESDPYAIVARLLAAVPPGSYLVISHPAKDIQAAAAAKAVQRYNQLVSTPQTRRTHAEVSRFFDGLELLEPGSCNCTNGGPSPAHSSPPARCRATAG